MGETRTIRIGIGLLAGAVALMAAWIVSHVFLGLYIDALWFAATGYGGVFSTMLTARALVWAAAFAVSLLLLLTNVHVAYRHAPLREDSVLSRLELDPVWTDRVIRRFAYAGTIALAGLLAFSVSGNWIVFLNFVYAVPFGMADPVFGHDIGFYVFVLPALAYCCQVALMLLALTAIAVAAAYYQCGAIDARREGKLLDGAVFTHLSALASAAAALFGIRLWLAQYYVLFDKRGAVFGAGYTDVHAQIGANRVLTVIAIALAIWLALNVFWQRRPANQYVFAACGLAWIGLGAIYPWSVQAFLVRPNEWEREQEYLRRNIEFTRVAYGLDRVEQRPWQGDAPLGPPAIEAHAGTAMNLPLWDSERARDVFNQKQRIRAYYVFNHVDEDRYETDGMLRPVLIAPRELASEQIPEKSRVWTNLHLYYTHGYGLGMCLANGVEPGGLPRMLVGDIPPDTIPDLHIEEPRIYYGERTMSYALTGTQLDEFDYPGDPDNFFNRYSGKGGVRVGGILRRALLTWHTGDKDILFTGQFTPESRILLFRQVRERAAKLAPFLFFDEDPYPVLHDGRITWILDGYVITRRFPYAEAIGIANYWRNAVKVTIDAYDGTVTFYDTGQGGPILDVFARVFPGMFRPLDEMPEGLRRHLRYPKDMFRVQTTIYHKYHVDDPQVFFNGEDIWTFPKVTEGDTISYESPRYTVMELPGAGSPAEFLLVRSFTVEGKDNMVAWMAGRCDGEHYGELHLLKMPKQRNIYGPNQAKGRFNQDPDVSEFMTLMGQLGSTVLQSKVFAAPVAEGLLYLQSLYIEDPEVKIPELKQVVLGAGDRVAMAPTLDAALAQLNASAGASMQTPGSPPGPASAGAALPEESARQAQELYRRAQDCLKHGDWTGFGEAFEALGRLLAPESAPSP